jgi:hypothetical protein
MIKRLRKRHLQIWTFLAIFIPVGFISSYLAIPGYPTNKLLQPSSSEVLPVINKTIEKKDYVVSLRSNITYTKLQLEWKNKTAAIYPSLLIYQLAAGSENMKAASIIGRVEARGTYYFPLKGNTDKVLRFALYDIIHGQLIDTINLNQ